MTRGELVTPLLQAADRLELSPKFEQAIGELVGVLASPESCESAREFRRRARVVISLADDERYTDRPLIAAVQKLQAVVAVWSVYPWKSSPPELRTR